MFAKGREREWGGMDWEFAGNKVLLYSTANYIQYPVINHNGKECKNECIYIYLFIYLYMNNGITLLSNRN